MKRKFRLFANLIPVKMTRLGTGLVAVWMGALTALVPIVPSFAQLARTPAPPPERSRLIMTIAALGNSSVADVGGGRPYNIGGGALGEFMLTPRLGLETGVLLINRQYDLSQGSSRLVQKSQRIHIPILARFWAFNWLSLGAGPYLSFRGGPVKTDLQEGDQNLGNTSAAQSLQYGLDLAATLNWKVYKRSSLFLEARYSALESRQSASETSNEVTALAGVKIGL